ncbi:helix-turn-helix domain-containing protein [Amycolatopsis sp.]|uniref:MarR family winged helix-turn-helix transcriptional regulator n=1 Tax=Amycolatopsis sp. TaxID=37632 RepID=UPI002CF900DF|nr:helix-turn-helix domain-containing protein [Amycolatopsis sp.]HVV10519.1 helix-turn-helix domain-containing protein [Amycolatopsis sp.]
MTGDGEHALAYLVDEVLRTHGRLLAANGDLAADEGLTGAQVLVLTAVVRAERPPTVPQIGRSLGHTRQSVQRLVDALVARGFVELAGNPDHKRAPLLLATADGRAAQRRVDRKSQSWMARVSEGIAPGDVGTATKVLHTLRARLEADAARTSSRHRA